MEQRPVNDIIASLPAEEEYAVVLLRRLQRVADIPQRAAVLDVGAAQGLFLIACAKLNHRVAGIEPWADARLAAKQIADRVGVSVDVVDGTAETMPFPNASFDIVRANSVIEHVVEPAAVMKEVFRVLKPGGIFWFLTASSLCPAQGEIRGFPAFGWYPNWLKLKVMHWASAHRPDLIGGTAFPAIHWFTPAKARRMLRQAGFSRVYDRWDLRLPDEGGRAYKLMLSIVKVSPLAKLVADIAVPCCSYAAVK